MTLSVVADIEYSGAAERPEDVDAGRLEHVGEVGPGLYRHALAQA